MIIAICHSIYLLMNFMVMSQASIAAVGLRSISQFNVACKISFMLFPPTTAYTLLHQLAIWLLVYAIRQHGIKLRSTSTHSLDMEESDEAALMMQGGGEAASSSSSDPNSASSDESSGYSDKDEDEDDDDDDIGYKYKDDIYNSFDEADSNPDEEDTVSQSLTNNSQPSSSRAANGEAPVVSTSSLGGTHRWGFIFIFRYETLELFLHHVRIELILKIFYQKTFFCLIREK